MTENYMKEQRKEKIHSLVRKPSWRSRTHGENQIDVLKDERYFVSANDQQKSHYWKYPAQRMRSETCKFGVVMLRRL